MSTLLNRVLRVRVEIINDLKYRDSLQYFLLSKTDPENISRNETKRKNFRCAFSYLDL